MTTSFVNSAEFQASVDGALARAHELFGLHDRDALSSSDSSYHAPSALASLGTIPAKMLANSCDYVHASAGIVSHAFVPCVDALVRSLRTHIMLGVHPSAIAHKLVSSLKQVTHDIASNFERIGFDASCSALQQAASHCGISACTCDMVIDAMRLAGLTGRVRTELCVSAKTDSIELTCGHTFNGEPVLRTNDVTPWQATNARCVFIDGIVESVSEIDSLLSHAHSAREPLFICARGFGGDAVSTIAVNRARRTLDVHIVKAPFDVAGANMLKDMAMTIGADAVSSLQGSLISAIKFDELKRVGRVTVIGGTVTLSLLERNPVLQMHVAELARMRAACTVPAMSDVYSERIKSLSSTGVSIKICGSKRTSSTKLYEADTALRAMRMLLSHGCIAGDALCTSFGPMNDALRSAVKELRRAYGAVPAAALIVVLNAAAECASALCLSAGVVALDARSAT